MKIIFKMKEIFIRLAKNNTWRVNAKNTGGLTFRRAMATHRRPRQGWLPCRLTAKGG